MNKVYLLSVTVIKALELYSEKVIMHFAEAAETQASRCICSSTAKTV